MITVLAFILGVGILAATFTRSIYVTLIAVALSVSVGLLLAFEDTPRVPEHEVGRDVVLVDSLTSNRVVTGDFFLGNGEVDTRERYVYWVPDSTRNEGAMRRQVLEKEHVEVITGAESPRIEFVKYQKKPTYWKLYTHEVVAQVYTSN